MATEDLERLLRLHEEVLDLPHEQRTDFLQEQCSPAEREHLERMLSVEDATEFLEHATPSPAPLPAGDHVGPFRIVRLLGRGGMGVVYEAEQDYPQRRVALKMLGVVEGDSRSLQRFREEVELLARLNHPGIAHVLEAGVATSPEGGDRPYFAMEYVRDAQGLLAWGHGRSLNQRLLVFEEVCEAVQHGHQMGVVHRDLKPANILVGSQDRPKVIDFGVARVLDEDRDQTRATQAGELVGTLRYMAPEQLAGDLVDTRTDVYALGLVLYELCAGQAPFDFESSSLMEIAQTIQAASPAPLPSQLPRELRWILFRALEKEPGRRYASASELLADLRRYRTGQPVEAGPPSALYVAAKFARRHRVAVASAGLLVATIAVAAVVSFASMVKAKRDTTRFRALNELLVSMLTSDRNQDRGYDLRAADLLDDAAEQLDASPAPELEAPLRATLAESYAGLGLFEPAEREARRALELRGYLETDVQVQALVTRGRALLQLARLEELQALLKSHPVESLPLQGRLPWRQLDALRLLELGRYAESLAVLEQLAKQAASDGSTKALLDIDANRLRLHSLLGQPDRALQLADAMVATWTELPGEHPADLLIARANRAGLYKSVGQPERGIDQLNELLPRFRTTFGAEHWRTVTLMGNLASAYSARGDSAEAVPLLEEVLRIREAAHGPDHSATLMAQGSLGAALGSLDPERAEELLRTSFERGLDLYGPQDPRTLRAHSKLGIHLRSEGQLEDALPILEEAWERMRDALDDDNLDLHRHALELGLLHQAQERLDQACEFMERAWRGYRRRLPDGGETLTAGNNYASALQQNQRAGEAIEVLLAVRETMLRVLAPADRRILTVTNNLGVIHAQRGEIALAVERMVQSVAWCEQHLAAQDPDRLNAYENLAFLLMNEQRASESLELYEQLMNGLNDNPKVPPHQRSAYRLGYARCLRSNDLDQRALAEYETLIEIESARLGADHEWIDTLAAERDAMDQ